MFEQMQNIFTWQNMIGVLLIGTGMLFILRGKKNKEF